MLRTTKSKPEQTDPTRISFRLDADTAAELARQAEAAGTSPSLYARDLVLSRLADRDETRQELRLIRHQLGDLRADADLLRRIRGDIVSCALVLLVNAGKLERQEAEQWVRQTLLNE